MKLSFFLLLIGIAWAAISSNPIQSGTVSVVSSATNPVTNEFFHNFPTAFGVSPWALLSVMAIQNVNNGTEWGFKAQIKMPIDVTGLTIQYAIVGPSTILKLLKVRYFAVDRDMYPNILVDFVPCSFSGSGLASGSGSRSQIVPAVLQSGNFIMGANSTQMSLMGFIVGFFGRFDPTQFTLSVKMSIVSSNSFRVNFKTSGNNIFYNASVYLLSCINNLTMFSDTGFIYGVNNLQLNSILPTATPDKLFFGLTKFNFSTHNVHIQLDSSYRLSSSTTYNSLIFQYMYSKLDVLCGGSACVCYEGFRQEVGCPEICGDGRLYVLDCDDGNTQEGDGCNNQCEVEQDWKCFKTGGWSTSGCTYVGYFTMGFVTADKNVGNDTANITLTVSPWFADMHSLNWLNILTTNSTSYTPIAIQAKDGNITIFGSYTAQIQGLPMTWQLTPAQRYINAQSSSFSFIAQSKNGLKTLPTSDYSYLYTICYYSSIVLSALYWVAFLIALFSGKIIGVEMMSVLQIGFLGLMTVDWNAGVEGLMPLGYAMGWNPLFKDLGDNSPGRLLPFGIKSIFLSDYNLMIATFLLPPIVSLIIYLVCRCKKQVISIKQKYKLESIAIQVLADGSICMALLNCYAICSCLVLNFVYQKSLAIPSVVFGCILVAFEIAICFVYYFKNKKFSECITIFSTDTNKKLARYHPIIMMLDRICFSLVVTLTFEYSYSPYILLGQTSLYTLFILIKNPYQLKRDYYRSIYTQLTILIILSIYCVFRNSSNLTISIYLPFLVLALALANLIVNLYFIGISIDEYKIEASEEREREEMIAKISRIAEEEVEKSFVKDMKRRALQIQSNDMTLNYDLVQNHE